MQLVDDVALGAAGEHALFLIRTYGSLDAGEAGIVEASWQFGNNVTYSESLLRSLLFIQAHPIALSVYESHFYNATVGDIQVSSFSKGVL